MTGARGRLEAAAELVQQVVPPTPQRRWPLLAARARCDLWVKHENHAPTGAFKVRGGLVYLHELLAGGARPTGVIAATRGNHGQSVAFAAARHGLAATVVVPHGNSREKNAAMRAFGATLLEHGRDFQEALEYARGLASERNLHYLASFAEPLVRGVASYALELFQGVPNLDAVYVPVGMGSGICGVIAARDALGLRTRIVGVVSDALPAYRLSFEAGRPVPTPPADTIADGLACRVPDADAVAMIRAGVDRVVSVSETAIRAAMRYYFSDTHNVVEGAGAAPLAAVLAEPDTVHGRRVAVIASGGNVDREVYGAVLREGLKDPET
ncbi:MAG: threonine dehydratase [Gemmatimonadota bacterium]|nr:threonine dehydratase [Gemmatimonadota bacterium]